MALYAYPVLYALFVWWFSTGLIIYLDGLAVRTFRWSMLGATLVLVLSLWGLAVSSADATPHGAYVAFTCALLAWGWQEMGFYTGFVTGPARPPCAEGCSGWRHLGHAIHASLYHEIAILAGAGAVFALTWGQPNQIGTWTFVVLWWMHQSAKLNVLFGVPNLSEQFLPPHLGFLRSFLTRRPMNRLFPVSVTVSTVVAVLLVQRATAAGASEFQAVGETFVASLLVLAVLEHWFLVVPLPVDALWNWSLRSRPDLRPFEVEVVAGCLGAGKTTVLRRLLAAPGRRPRGGVNDFGAVGVDGSLLSGRGAEVVELADGCICCSLRQDLSRQLDQAVRRFTPERVLIEPSGVADLAALIAALDQPGLRDRVRRLRLTVVVDAATFLADYATLAATLEAQARLAGLIVLNKADLVAPAELRLIEDTLRAVNPDAAILPARYGVLSAEAPSVLPCALSARQRQGEHKSQAHAEAGPSAHAHADPLSLGSLTSWSAQLHGACDPQELRTVLDEIARGAFGQVERVKGIAQLGTGWVHFDVAGGRPSMAAFAARADEQPRVVAIGRRVDEAALQAAFAACAIP